MNPTLTRILELPLIAWSEARSASYAAQYIFLNRLSALMPGDKKPAIPQFKKEVVGAIRREMHELFVKDTRNIVSGLYPASVLKPESPVRHLMRMPRIISDGVSIQRRRVRGRTTEFKREAKEFLEEVPRYYRRNFHYQTNGYLSRRSADLYEHQVEMLFSGSADPMRRLILPELRARFGSTDGKGLRFLEIGAGTGRATRFVHLAFPKAKIVATDLSDPYLMNARRSLEDCSRIDFMQADGAALPFSPGHFDAVYSVFLFHELPLSARKAILKEAKRVLKPGGFLGVVDSIQRGDKKRFDSLLLQFPMDFHEPFYRDYLAHPLEKLVAAAGFRAVGSELGFFSKVVTGAKAR